MDGYAVLAEDTFGAARERTDTLRRVDTIFTGDTAAARRSSAGECIEIATGAPMPAGADAVVMVEETDDGTASGRVRVHRRRCIRASTSAGAAPTSPPGRPSFAPGDLLNPSRVGALAAIGAADVEVFAQPRSRSFRPATRSSSPASRSRPARSTTSTGSR